MASASIFLFGATPSYEIFFFTMRDYVCGYAPCVIMNLLPSTHTHACVLSVCSDPCLHPGDHLKDRIQPCVSRCAHSLRHVCAVTWISFIDLVWHWAQRDSVLDRRLPRCAFVLPLLHERHIDQVALSLATRIRGECCGPRAIVRFVACQLAQPETCVV